MGRRGERCVVCAMVEPSYSSWKIVYRLLVVLASVNQDLAFENSPLIIPGRGR
jgi:hypothetical protein